MHSFILWKSLLKFLNTNDKMTMDLTYFKPMLTFSTTWKHKKQEIFWCFERFQKGIVGLKRINKTLNDFFKILDAFSKQSILNDNFSLPYFKNFKRTLNFSVCQEMLNHASKNVCELTNAILRGLLVISSRSIEKEL